LVVISYPTPPTNQSSDVLDAFTNSSSPVTNYFSMLDLNVTSINVTQESVIGTTIGPLGTLINTAENIVKHETLLEKYLLLIVIAIPAVVVIVSVVIGVVAWFMRRRENIRLRKRNWDMQKMYSSISFVDYT